MGLKGSRAVQDRRVIERRVATLETRRRHLVAMRPALAAQAWDAAREFDRGLRRPVGQVLVEAVFGPDPRPERKSVATKDNDPCREKAAPDEPIFTLRAQDRCAPAAVRDWANRARGAGCDPAKVQEAMDVARAMEEWSARTGRRKWPD
jgi:hypothetical protein